MERHKFVYVAGPYTQGDPVLNVRAAVAAADELLNLGLVPFVPHLSHLWHTISPKPYDAWIRLDLYWLRKCDALLRLPGPSHGADAEVAYAVDLGIPVYYSVAEVVRDAE